MGGSTSKTDAVKRAEGCFSKDELAKLGELFTTLSGQRPGSKTPGPLTEAQVEQLLRLPPFLCRRVMVAFAAADPEGDTPIENGRPTHLSFGTFIVGLAAICRLAPDARKRVLFSICDVEGEGTVNRDGVTAIVNEMLIALAKDSSIDALSLSSEALLPFLDLIFAGRSELDIKSFESLSRLAEVFERFLPEWLNAAVIRKACYANLPTTRVLSEKGALPRLDVGSKLLSAVDVWFLGGALATDQRHEWRRLYETSCDGASFSTFMGNLCRKGPAIIVLRDKQGAVFGCYGSQAWERQTLFYGDGHCLLFSLRPTLAIYEQSGANRNWMWSAQNAKTVPNGVGMGGCTDYFGLFISADFEHGESRAPCSTFDSPCLASAPSFEIETIEAWACQPDYVHPTSDSDEDESSVLDRNKVDMRIMELGGKTFYSEDVRKADEQAKQAR